VETSYPSWNLVIKAHLIKKLEVRNDFISFHFKIEVFSYGEVLKIITLPTFCLKTLESHSKGFSSFSIDSEKVAKWLTF